VNVHPGVDWSSFHLIFDVGESTWTKPEPDADADVEQLTMSPAAKLHQQIYLNEIEITTNVLPADHIASDQDQDRHRHHQQRPVHAHMQSEHEHQHDRDHEQQQNQSKQTNKQLHNTICGYNKYKVSGIILLLTAILIICIATLVVPDGQHTKKQKKKQKVFVVFLFLILYLLYDF
jgi:hypothetical protein